MDIDRLWFRVWNFLGSFEAIMINLQNHPSTHSYNVRYIFSFVDNLLGCFWKVSFSLQLSTITLPNHQNISLTGGSY